MSLILGGSGATISASLSNTAIAIDTTGRVTTPVRPHAICKLVSGNSGAYNAAAIVSTLIPTNVIRNVGGIYNSTNGQFTAPVAGLYELNFHSNIYTAPAATWIMVRSYINGVEYSQHYSDKVSTSWQYMSTHDLMYLNANDYAYLTVATASGTTGCDINNYTLISFALIG